MVKKHFTIFLISLFSLAAACLFGQTEQYKFKRLDLKDGLSHPDIWSIFKDSRGFVWFGTALGLNRFDGYTIKSFLYNPHDTSSLPGDGVYGIFETPDRWLGIVTAKGFALYDPDAEKFQRNLPDFFEKYNTSKELFNIVRDKDGSWWFVEPDKLVRYHPEEKNRVVIHANGFDSSSMVKSAITDFHIDHDKNHWVIHSNGIAEKIEINNGQGKVVQRISALHEQYKSVNTTYEILSDLDGDLWISTPGLSQGVFFYSMREHRLTHVTENSFPWKLNNNSAGALIEDKNGLIWVGTDHGGINIIDKKKNKVTYILHRDGDEMSLAANSIDRLYLDDQGIVWAGAYKRGISYYHPDIYRFEVYKHYSIDPGSLPFEDVNRFEEDKKGNLWIGTNGGGLLYFDRQSGKFKQYLHEPGNPNSLSGNVIVSLYRDAEDNLWIGTFKGGLNKFDGKKFTHYSHVAADSTSLPSENIWEIFEDSKKRIWIGTIDVGAARFDVEAGKFHLVRAWQPNGLQAATIEDICEDRHGNIWFGTPNGIDVMSADGKTITHYGSSASENSLASNTVFDIMKDARGRMWVATSAGLDLFDEAIKGFRSVRENRNNSAVLTIKEDNFGNLWMSTFNGLSEMIVTHGAHDSVSFRHYTESDGLQGRQFNLNASFKTSKGELIFGGPTGFNIFDGAQHREDPRLKKIVFTELELYEKPIGIQEEIDGVTVLKKSISEADEIVLPPGKNFFSLKFSALNYFNPERDAYVYKLEGLNSGWLPVGSKSHEIIFNSLNPGNYKLRIKAANGDGVWSDKEAVLSISILPPFWRTNTAFALYACFLVAILYVARRVIQQREKLKYALEHERREMQRIQELDLLKVKFFTNVSHEFRTPLTLILTPIEKLVKKVTDPEQKVQFQLIQRNGKRLMNLVNQLLDFKKLEVHEIKFTPSRGDVIAFVKDTVLSFSDLAEKKHIRLQFNTSVDHLETLFDHDKLEKILFNLLSNAFKFTLENGLVSVDITLAKDDNNPSLQIDVRDTGIGIPEDKLENIFEPFFQTDMPKSIINTGSGIGLSITKEFVKIHGGRICVTSEVGKGSCFTISLPVTKLVVAEDMSDAFVQEEDLELSQSEMQVDEADKQHAHAKKKSLLLIEDNDDFRFYLKDNLKFSYTIYEARNGREGWNQVLSLQPDLVVSDMMMPEMNGVELCEKMKTDERVSHIPIILLTARSSEEQRIEGFNAGAEDYITKPFNFEVLEARINNLLKQREKFQKQFRKTLDVKASELQITPLDVKFVEKAIKVVEAQISSPEFSVEDLGMELGISRAYVFKKILALTGKTPLEFIRNIRLQHAIQLLEKSQLSVQEVAYKVGFNNPKYFTKYFKEQYGILPSEYAAGKRKEA